MQASIKRTLLAGLAMLTVTATGMATLGYRASGVACLPVSSSANVSRGGDQGLRLTSVGNFLSGICSIPQGPGTVSISSTASNMLTSVNMRYHTHFSGNIYSSLFVHDNNSFDYDECDVVSSSASAGTHVSHTLDNECSGQQGSWSIATYVEALYPTGQYLTIKQVNAHY